MKQLIAGYDLTPKTGMSSTIPVWFIVDKQLYQGWYHNNGHFYHNNVSITGVTHWCYDHEMTPDQLRRIATLLEANEPASLKSIHGDNFPLVGGAGIGKTPINAGTPSKGTQSSLLRLIQDAGITLTASNGSRRFDVEEAFAEAISKWDGKII